MIVSCSPTPYMFFVAVFVCVYMWIILFWDCASKNLAQPQNLAEVLTLVHDTLVSPMNKETLANNVHKPISSSAHFFSLSFFFFLLHWSQICLRCITFPVVCAGLGRACLPAGESREQRRQQVRGRCTFFRGSPAGIPNVCSSQRGILNIPHSVLLRNRNWFGSQGANSVCKVEHVECMGYFTTPLSTAMCDTLLQSLLMIRLFSRYSLFITHSYCAAVFSLS